MAVTEVVFIRMFFLTVGSKQKNKDENMKYHCTFTLFKIQLYSKQENSTFLLFGLWNLALYSQKIFRLL